MTSSPTFFILLGALLLLTNANVVKDKSNLFYEGRSGNIIISTGGSAGIQLSWDVGQNQLIEDVQVYNLLARTFRVPRVPVNAELKVPIDLFSRPKGNLLFSIEGLSEKQIPGGSQILGVTPVRSLLPPAEQPSNLFSILATALTGFSPKEHGVINKRYPSMKSENELYTVANFYDYVLQYHPSTTILSASSSRYAANVLAPHKDYVRSSGSASMYWDNERNTFVSPSGGFPDLIISASDYVELMQSLSKVMKTSIKYDAAEAVVTVGTTSFDLSDESASTLFAEVMFVLTVGSRTRSSPQFFSFHFQSLKMISREFGTESPEFQSALAMVDAVIAYAVQNYGDEATYSIFYASDSQKVEQIISPIVSDFIRTETSMLPTTTFASYFPHIYLTRSDPIRREQMCFQINDALTQASISDAKVYCPSSERTYLRRGIMATPNHDPNDNDLSRQVAGFHVAVWMGVTLFFILLTAIYYLFTMTIAQDSMLYMKSSMALSKGGPAKGKKAAGASVAAAGSTA